MNKELTPKEEAEQLFQLYLPFVQGGHIEETKYRCKQCALIAVYKIMNMNSVDRDYDLSHFWQEVEWEIENL